MVKRATCKKTGKEVAIKIFRRYVGETPSRSSLDEEGELALRNEVEILSQVADHHATR